MLIELSLLFVSLNILLGSFYFRCYRGSCLCYENLIVDILTNLKYILIYPLLWLRYQQNVRKAKKLVDQSGSTILPSEENCKVESPQNVDFDQANDAIAFQGCSDDGHHILIRFGRRANGVNEIWLILRIPNPLSPNGFTILTLPEHPATTLMGSGDNNCWSVGGLTCEPREPMRKWRIFYNGWMRKGIRTDYSTNADESDLVHVKFAFIWSSLSSKFDFDTDLDPSLMAASLSYDHWCSRFFNTLRSCHETRYEQWGQMIGRVELQDQQPIELKLRGMRDHCFGKRDWRRYKRYIATCGYSENGTFFHIGAVNIPNATTNLIYGYVGLESGELWPINRCSLDLTTTGADGIPPDRFSIHFEAGGKSYLARMEVHTTVPVFNAVDWPSKSFLRFVKIDINGEPGEGFSEFEYRNDVGRPESVPIPPRKIFLHRIDVSNLNESEGKLLVVPLSHRAAQCEDLVGGKGKQLAQLYSIQSSFSVPNAVCLTTNAFKEFLKENVDVGKLCLKLQTERSIADLSSRIVNGIQSGLMPSTVERVLTDQLSRVFGQRWAEELTFAVRSSAVGEDSADASCAGQMETILGVRGQADVIRAVLQCWASMFTVQAIQYRREIGQPPSISCGVVIQQLVKAQCSGVLFTCDPVTGHPGKIVINANYGLGESVVSGIVEPDTITISRSYQNKIVSISAQAGQKSVKLEQTGDSLATVEVSSDDRTKLCLSGSQISALTDAAVEVESYFEGFVDLEWAYDSEKLYLLQSRPITTLKSETNYELLHEFDTPICSNYHYSTTANVGEVMGGTNTPLSLNVAGGCLDKAIQANMVDNGILDRLLPDSWFTFTIYQNHMMLNLSRTVYINAAAAATRRVPELCILGREIVDPHLDQLLLAKHKDQSRWQSFIYTIKMITSMRRGFKLRLQYADRYNNYNLDISHLHKSADLWKSLTSIMPDLCHSWNIHTHNSGYSAMWYHVIMGILSKHSREWGAEQNAAVALLYSGSSGAEVESADVPTALHSLTNILRTSDHFEEFLAMSPKDANEWLMSKSSGTLGVAFREFLDRHGHRCIKEIGFEEKSWSEEPTRLIDVLQHSLKLDHSGERDLTSINSVGEAISHLNMPLNGIEKLILKFIIPKARNGVAYREQTKSMGVKVGMAFRKGYRKLSQLLVQENKLPEEELLYYLTHYELGQLVQSNSVELVKRAKARRRCFAQQSTIALDDVIVGYPFVAKEDLSTVSTVSEGSGLRGTPVCSGSVKAKVRVAVTLDQAKDLQRGEILVTRCTDIAWSVYFPLLSGVVTELGGLLSHGAVVAREYGLPCLVSVRNCTTFFTTGNLVVLDSSRGIIYKVEE